MRQTCDWFSRRAEIVWNAKPGRSMLVIVPHGCEESMAARLVGQWVTENFVLPSAYANHRATCIDLVADELVSSKYFASAVARNIARQLGIEIEGDDDDQPTDVLQNAVESALGAGAYPILKIERFNTFARIKDGGLISVLSRLRTMESDGQLTTLAFSPMSYDAIRRTMEGEQPFLNSVYGDMHDQAVMTPLAREDFLAEANRRGVRPDIAHRLFKLGGGPDVIFHHLLDASLGGDRASVEQCAERVGPTIDRFLNRAFPELSDADPLIDNLAIGCLNPAQQAHLLNHPLADFLCKRKDTNEVVCSSPIIARRILARGLPIWSRYGACVKAIEAEDYEGAAELAANLSDDHPRLAAFRELVLLRGALTAVVPLHRGLLGLDWQGASEATKRLRGIDPATLSQFAPWLKVVEQSVQIVLKLTGDPRLRADHLTRRASENEVRHVLLFMMEGLIRATPQLLEPAAKVQALVNLPETILQTLAAGFCGIDFSNAPSDFPAADYDAYFGGRGPFRIPRKGDKLNLGHLIVIVPALLAERQTSGAKLLKDAKQMKPLQQKLSDTIRNASSHTYSSFLKEDAQFLQELCRLWINEWWQMEGMESIEVLPMWALAPDGELLRALVIG